jgi:hypothetical protein
MDSQGYIIYDLDNIEMERNMGGSGDDGLNPVGAGEMTDLHVANFCDAIRDGSQLNQPIAEGYKSPLLCHLGNIAQFSREALRCDPRNGHILGNASSTPLWSRSYEAGWKPQI